MLYSIDQEICGLLGILCLALASSRVGVPPAGYVRVHAAAVWFHGLQLSASDVLCWLNMWCAAGVRVKQQHADIGV